MELPKFPIALTTIRKIKTVQNNTRNEQMANNDKTIAK